MPTCIVDRISTSDVRYPLPPGAGSDALHTNPEYCLAVTRLRTDCGLSATGIALTLGDGNRLVCEAIELLAGPLVGLPIEESMADFGNMSKRLADDPALRWLGPHKVLYIWHWLPSPTRVSIFGQKAAAFLFGSYCLNSRQSK
jgi:L-fuconate dehydratase